MNKAKILKEYRKAQEQDEGLDPIEWLGGFIWTRMPSIALMTQKDAKKEIEKIIRTVSMQILFEVTSKDDR